MLMKESFSLKWFWGINYTLTLYKVIVLITLILPLLNINLKTDWFEYLNLESFTFLLLYFGEWVQVPAGILIMLFYKNQRTVFHYLYLTFLLLLSITSFIVFALLLGSLGDM